MFKQSRYFAMIHPVYELSIKCRININIYLHLDSLYTIKKNNLFLALMIIDLKTNIKLQISVAEELLIQLPMEMTFRMKVRYLQ